ncbi:MAG: CCA tRNA nucleotidyltransferase [Nitrospiraceae bacterium]|nr:MAG: CCA tRNA nucleotidyltransferase [Nitrospiraceae bacterium]
MDISKTILSDPINQWVFRTSPGEIFLVGGYVRDLLRNQISNDKDYVIKNAAEKIARKAAMKFHGTFVLLKRGQTYRTVIKPTGRKPQVILDFNVLKSNIYNDIKERDFTINAIAWGPQTGIMDPMYGQKDIKRGIIRPVRVKNLFKDPLRILRAYRFAAELGFLINRQTRKHLAQYAKKLTQVAPERITEEIFKILNMQNSSKNLDKCCKDRVLGNVFFTKAKNRSNCMNILKENIKLLRKFDLLHAQMIRSKYKTGKNVSFREFFTSEVSQGLNRAGLIRLFLLFRDLDIDDSSIKVSRSIQRALKDMNSGNNIIEVQEFEKVSRVSRRRLNEIFNNSGERVDEIAIILSMVINKDVKNFLIKAREFIRIRNRKLLNGKEVQRISGIKQGEKIGLILAALKERQINGLIRNTSEARDWIRANYT